MERHIRRLIAVDGPIPVSRYMAEALGHPVHGYYSRADAIAADFLTAPEASQMFGELLGLALAHYWRMLGAPVPVRLVELGPGRGRLLADLLRATRRVPGFHAAVDLHLVETSAALRQVQATALAPWRPQWHDGLASLPAGPWLLLANEFLDALPVRQLQRTAEGWREVLIAADASGLRFTLSPQPLPEAAVPPALRGAGPGATVELGPARAAVAARIGEAIAAGGGLACLIDYGPATPCAGGTLQAVRRHRHHPVLAAPGAADLTAHVDFAGLREAAAAAGAAVYGPRPQGEVLEALGIRVRAAQLMEAAGPDRAAAVARGLHRLTAPEAMGRLFKVLAVAAPGQPAPPGFEDAA